MITSRRNKIITFYIRHLYELRQAKSFAHSGLKTIINHNNKHIRI